jgi:hypothetical protein
MMEAVRTSETSVYLNETARHYSPEAYHLYTRCHENLKSHKFLRALIDRKWLVYVGLRERLYLSFIET